MFSSILLTDGTYDICDSKQIRNRKKDNTCTVNFYGRSRCSARLLACNESREMLVSITKFLNTGSPKVRIKDFSDDIGRYNNSSILDCSSSPSEALLRTSFHNASPELSQVLHKKKTKNPGTASLSISCTPKKSCEDNCRDEEDQIPDLNSRINVRTDENECTYTLKIDDTIILAPAQQLPYNDHQVLYDGEVSNIFDTKLILDDNLFQTTDNVPQNINTVITDSNIKVHDNSDQQILDFSGLAGSENISIENIDSQLGHIENRNFGAECNNFTDVCPSIKDDYLEPTYGKRESSKDVNENIVSVESVKQRVHDLKPKVIAIEILQGSDQILFLEQGSSEMRSIGDQNSPAEKNGIDEQSITFDNVVTKLIDRQGLCGEKRTEDMNSNDEEHLVNDRKDEAESFGEVQEHIDDYGVHVDSIETENNGLSVTSNQRFDSRDSQADKNDNAAKTVIPDGFPKIFYYNESENEKLCDANQNPISEDPGHHDNEDDDDSDYRPSENELSADDNQASSGSGLEQTISGRKRKRTTNTSTESNRLSLSFTANVPGASACDDTKLSVDGSRGRAGDKKEYCCVYCHKILFKIARHFQDVHSTEPGVIKFMKMTKGSTERRKEIAKLRKEGNFLFNTNCELNSGKRIVERRPSKKFKRSGSDYAFCAKCKGSYSKNTFRMHFAACTKISSKNTRSALLSAKQVAGMVHPLANEVVRKRIIPVLREDDVSRAVRYDELLITFTNNQCRKYRSEHHDKMIIQRLRMLGRLLLAIKTKNEKVTDFASVFNPEVYDDFIFGVNHVAGLDESTNSYKAPSTASMLGTLTKQIGKKHISDCIKKKNNDLLTDAENFLKLLDEDYIVSVNSTVAENQAEQRRKKVINIPLMEDIQKLHDYLSRERKRALKSMDTAFSLESWRDLAETSLTSIQLFNRRRAGEFERLKITDFETYKGVDEKVDKDAWDELSEAGKVAARKYVRFQIRGKKGRPVSVLLSSEMLKCLKVVLKYRKTAKVQSTNPYVFGLPAKFKVIHRHLNSCVLMRKFSTACGASDPVSLRGTELRKHMATKCLTLNLNEQDVGELANFMGHSTDIHKQVYRQTIIAREITNISKLLEKAQGDENETDDDDSERDGDEKSNDEASDDERLEYNENDSIDYSENIQYTDNVTAGPSTNQSTPIPQKTRGRPPSILATKRGHEKLTVQATQSFTKNRRSSSPHGPVKRVKWTQLEQDTLLKQYGHHISADSKTFPSLKCISELIQKNPSLRGRTPQQVKSWLSNRKQHNKKLTYGSSV